MERKRIPDKRLVRSHIPARIRDLFGKPPLIGNEDPNQYDALMEELVGGIQPNDVIEWLWFKDIADLSWEIIRYRRVKASHVDAGFKVNLISVLEPLVQGSDPDTEDDETDTDDASDKAKALAHQWYTNPRIKRQIDKLLKANGLDSEVIATESFIARIEALGLIESLLASAELRRNNTLREIERHRGLFGGALRRESERVIGNEAPLVPLASK